MQVSLKRAMMPITAATMLALAACSSPAGRARDYMQDKTYEEYKYIASNGDCKTQSKLDSLAFRDVFNGTQAAQDSAMAAEFNKIASTYRRGVNGSSFSNATPTVKNFPLKITSKINRADDWTWARGQYLADEYAYWKFFKDNGLFDEETKKNFLQAMEKVKPDLLTSHKVVKEDLKK